MTDQNSQFFAILTDIGRAKQANANALGTPWTFAQMGVGDANDTNPVPNSAQTKLINERRRAPLNQLKVDPTNANVIIAEQVIPDSVGGWWVRELALYDKDGDMVAVANCAPTYKPLIAQGSGRTQVIRINLIVSNTANIELKIDPSVVLATREYVDVSVIEALAKLDHKQSVRVVATQNIVLAGAQQIGAIAVVAGDRVGVVGQTAAKDNGIWVVASGPWARSFDANSSAKVTPGLSFVVEEGEIHGGSGWQLVTTAPIVLGTTNLVFEKVTGRTGVADGTYRSVTVNKYGRVTEGSNPETLADSGITDGVTKTALANAISGVVAKTGATLTGSLILNSGQEDSPEFGWKTPSSEASFDIYNKNLRVFARCDGVDSTPILFNLPNRSAFVFGSVIWNAGNFNPDTKADKTNTYPKGETYSRAESDQQTGYRVLRDRITVAGLSGGDLNAPYMQRDSDGAFCMLQTRLGYTPVQQGGGIGQSTNKIYLGHTPNGVKLTVDTSDMGLIWCANNFTPDACLKLGQNVPSGSNPSFMSNGFPAIASIASGAGAFQVNGGDAASSAVMSFHRPGSFGVMFGLDVDSQLKIGGWSMGNVAHTIWHAGNRPKSTALLAPNGWSKNPDTGEIIQWLEYTQGDHPSTVLINITWPFQFPNQFLNAKITLKMPNGQTGCASVASYFGATTTGCTIRLEEFAAVLQTGMVVVVEARGF
ncbi:phage tail protein [Pseudomonas sp. ArH3a]|uniref:phage tail protein n=1 Tax=Pseudomonas sp. ArH3a TaxID=2862945 RepID=UPI001F5667FD|nr:phage tail protein [Pseudomonas sp. ArH3a]UNM21702.1 phage tail protein [Pseudomonas sp. ArH3a]